MSQKASKAIQIKACCEKYSASTEEEAGSSCTPGVGERSYRIEAVP